MRPAKVTAAVLPNDLAFLLEDGVGRRGGGRTPPEDGHHRRSTSWICKTCTCRSRCRRRLKPSQLVFLVLRWKNEGVDDEDRFAFRSPWLAWRAGRKLLEAKRG